MTPRRIAVVGSGIAGLGAAWPLSRRHQVTVFERDTRLGGHTYTHVFDRPHGRVTLDTGFLVHTDRTYPHVGPVPGVLRSRFCRAPHQ